MLTLVFDTETTGFVSKSKPIGHESQPHLVQLAFMVLKDDMVQTQWSKLVRCPVEVPEGAYSVHGISREQTWEKGISLIDAVAHFDKFLKISDRFVCHNSNYDFPIMQNAYFRCGHDQSVLNSRPGHCTMLSLTPILKLEKRGRLSGYKWPTLIEAYKLLISEDGFKAHDALEDVTATTHLVRFLEIGSHPLIQTHNHGVTTI